jgi:hypothetical protein
MRADLPGTDARQLAPHVLLKGTDLSELGAWTAPDGVLPARTLRHTVA